MLDIPGQTDIDKATILGGCVRLPLEVDAGRLIDEVGALPEGYWGGTSGRVGVHRRAEAVFLRGYAPAEGDRPIEDRPALDELPYIRALIERSIPAPPMRCLLARLAAGATVPIHVDRAPYFSKTLRIHVPVETNPQVWMLADGRAYTMREGEVWVLNNSSLHGVVNGDPSRTRTHLICDFLPTAALLELILRGDRDLGRVPDEATLLALRS